MIYLCLIIHRLWSGLLGVRNCIYSRRLCLCTIHHHSAGPLGRLYNIRRHIHYRSAHPHKRKMYHNWSDSYSYRRHTVEHKVNGQRHRRYHT